MAKIKQEPEFETFINMLRESRIGNWESIQVTEREIRHPELVIAIARPQGTDDQLVQEQLRKQLESHNFLVSEVRLSNLIRIASHAIAGQSASGAAEKAGYERITDLMRMGDEFRARLSRSAVAEFGVMWINRNRREMHRRAEVEQRAGIAFVLSSLVHEAEVALLRSTYRNRLIVVGIHEQYERRRAHLEEWFAQRGSGALAKSHATEVLEIDAGFRSATGSASDASLSIDSTFHRADVFFRAVRPGIDAPETQTEHHVSRFVRQVFGYPFGAPTSDEFGMSAAYLAARQSVALGRSVGAAILSEDSSIVALGWNEPAKPFGGVSREGNVPDLREHHDRQDASDVRRIDALAELLVKLVDTSLDKEYERAFKDAGEGAYWLRSLRERVKELALPEQDDVRIFPAVRSLASSRLLNLIEFGRSVHAEMAAVTDAARRGVSTAGCSLYVTTFPCHECARNVVASGISRVVYVEPYGKSLAAELYGNAINVTSLHDGSIDGKRVTFEQFVGISPSRQPDLYSTAPRKHSLARAALDPEIRIGSTLAWDDRSPHLRQALAGYLSSDGFDPLIEGTRIAVELGVIRRLVAQLYQTYWKGRYEVQEFEMSTGDSGGAA